MYVKISLWKSLWTSASSCFKNLPKLQKCFECFLEFYKIDLNLSKSNWKEIILLAKTRWLERYKAYHT